MILFERVESGNTFRLIRGSLLDQPTDVIVNPANTDLKHGGGVAGLIVRMGGQDIQKESDGKAPLKTGQATVTGAGSLPFRAVIHTVGPIWRGGAADEPLLLRQAIESALDLADGLEVSSLSLPPVSTGVFGYPLDDAVTVIVPAIKTALEKSTHLKCVHLCELSEDKSARMKRLIEAFTLI